jgi:hypothetical protein
MKVLIDTPECQDGYWDEHEMKIVNEDGTEEKFRIFCEAGMSRGQIFREILNGYKRGQTL